MLPLAGPGRGGRVHRGIRSAGDRRRRRRQMANRAIVFALANPDPEIDPAEAQRQAEVVATGRSDFPNQINNVLAFPGVFRGLVDARSTEITDAMLTAAARALAAVVGDDELNAPYITPSVFHADVHRRVAQAVRVAAGG